MGDLPAKHRVIDPTEYSISLGGGAVREPESSIDTALLSKERFSKCALIAQI
jgi:hypothetical protein